MSLMHEELDTVENRVATNIHRAREYIKDTYVIAAKGNYEYYVVSRELLQMHELMGDLLELISYMYERPHVRLAS